MNEVDENGNGVCDFEEFQECVKILERRYEEKLREEKKKERQSEVVNISDVFLTFLGIFYFYTFIVCTNHMKSKMRGRNIF